MDAGGYITEVEKIKLRGEASMDEEQFFIRVDGIKGRLYKIAYAYLGSEDKAADAVDEAVYKGYMKRKQLREEAYLETWLTRVLINVCNQSLM